MKRNKIFAWMAMAMILAACSTNNDITSDTRYDDDNVVTIGTVTRVGESSTTSPAPSPFLLTNVTQRENVGYDYEATYNYDSSNSTWTAQDNAKIMWYGSGNNVFQATYPCKTKNGNVQKNDDFNKFVIPGYQYSDSDSIPDWMRATATIKRNNVALDLNFEHMLSKVTVEIDYNNITLDGNTVTSASVSKIFTRVQYCKAVTDADGKVTINPYQKTDYNTDGLYVWTTAQNDDTNKKTSTTAIVAPGDYTNIAKVSVFYDGGSEEIVLYLPAGYTLEAGKHYTFTLSNAAITHDQATISSVSVEPWTEGTISSSKPAEFIPYVTFASNEEVKFKMTANSGYTISGLEYSVNNGKWIPIPSNGISDGVPFGGTKGNLRLRGKNLNGTATNGIYYATISFTSDDTSAKVACTGDIRTLLDYENYNTVETNYACFCYLFKDCTRLTSTPALPAKTLADWCYKSMFYGCTSLTTAPELKAETLANYCYESMFGGCTSLATAPELPATTLKYNCYCGMFKDCTSLTTAPALPATTLANSCYSSMFSGCSSLTKAPELPATTLADYCYFYMFKGCTSLTTAPALPATTLARNCYSYMFNGCTSLTTAPELKAETLANSCYNSMFYNCIKLESVTMLATDVNASDCLYNWLYEAGTDVSETQRTLTVASQEAYNKIVDKNYYLPANWKIGAPNTTVKDKNGTILTSSSTTP